MIYEAYQQRVLKVAKVLKKIVKHLALIIGTVSVVALLVISFLATKGMIVDEIDIQPQVTYGEGISANAGALFSDVVYEYAPIDSDEWTTEVPTAVGEYKVRAKAQAAFGKTRYSKEVVFSILAKDIHVQILSQNVIYGEAPKIGADIGEDEILVCDSFTFEDITQKTTNVHANKESVKIYTENGEDKTSCYNIITETSKVNITPRPLEVTVSSKSMVYNGTPLAFDGYEISGGTLGYSDVIGAEFNSSITDIGTEVNIPVIRIRNENGADVTAHYDMMVRTGELTVTQRPIVVVTPSDEKTYDGEKLENTSVEIFYGEEITTEIETEGTVEEETSTIPLDSADVDVYPDWEIESILPVETYPETTADDYLYVEELEPEVNYKEEASLDDKQYQIDTSKVGLVDGHTIAINQAASIVNAGSVENAIYISIYDKDGNDKTANYSIFYDFGELTVKKRGLTVTTPSLDVVYDGKPHSTDYEFGLDGLVPGHTTDAKVIEVTDACDIENAFEFYIYDADGNSVYNNYEITSYFGGITIRKREIWVESGTASYTYDGYAHSLEGIRVGTDRDYIALADGHQIIVRDFSSFTDYTNGPQENNLDYYIIDENGKDVTYNYQIVENFGTIEILKRKLQYSTPDYIAMYDGYEHVFDSIILDDPNVFEGMAFVPQIDCEANVYKNYTPVELENDISFVIYGNMGEIARNFDIECTYMGKVNISKRNLTIITGGESWVYDGYSHENNEISFEGDGFADGEGIASLTFPVIQNVQSSSNSARYDICDSYGNSTIENYEITEQFGTIEVTQRYLPYATPYYYGTYNGYYQYADYIEADLDELFDGMAFVPSIVITDYTSVRNHTPEAVDNEISFKIVNKSGVDVTSNFNVECIGTGTITIAKRYLTVTSYDNEWSYDGNIHAMPFVDLGGEGIAEGDMFNIISGTEVKNNTHGYVDNIVLYEILNIEGADSIELGNYEIVEYYGKLRINPVHIYVIADDILTVYDGLDHVSSGIYVYDSMSDDMLYMSNYYSVLNSYYTSTTSHHNTFNITDYSVFKYYTGGIVENSFEFEILDSDGVNVIDEYENYIIDSIYFGQVDITKRLLGYSTGTNVDMVYNGMYQTNTDVFWHEYEFNGYDTLGSGDRIQILTITEIIDYSNTYIPNEITFTILDANGEDVSENYEFYLESYGELYIKKRNVYINTNSNTWVYDGDIHFDLGYEVAYRNGVESYDFIPGDILNIASYSTIKTYGTTRNTLSGFTIYSSERDKDVTDNYQIVTSQRGTLEILRRSISIKPVDASKVYDGEYLTVDMWEYAPTTQYFIVDGQTVQRISFSDNSYVNAGTYKSNVLSNIIIVDADGENVTNNYEINFVEGNIVIETIKIHITTGSITKEYDGITLEYPEFEVRYDRGSAVPGHTIVPNFTGKITGVGIVDNEFDGVEVYDAYGDPVTSNYEFDRTYGKLEITSAHRGEIYSEKDGYVYLKLESFGDYYGNGFYSEPVYTKTTVDGWGPEYLVSKAFDSLGYQATYMLVSGTDAKLYFNTIDGGDSYYTFPNDIYGDVSRIQDKLGNYTAYELNYRNWVYNNFLYVDYETQAYLENIIYANGFDKNEIDIYNDVAKFVQRSSKYGFTYQDLLDASDNIVISFFEHEYGDEALCRHFAAAATMLYRAMGIPARYTVGYLTETKAFEWTEVTEPGHAWVEVYIDSLGWVPVEVTAGSEGFTQDGNILGGGLGGILNAKERVEITLIPEDMTVTYTGEPVIHNQKYIGSANINELKSLGYEFDVVIGNEEAIDYGKYQSYIESVRIFYKGEDVTYQFKINSSTKGTINISRATLVVRTKDVTGTFDGNELIASNELEITAAIQKWIDLGYTFECKAEGGLVNVGSTYATLSEVKIIAPDGITDVTDNFTLFTSGGKIEVTPFEIEVFLYKNHKTYDGTPLTYDVFGGKYYSVRNTLPEGYEVTDLIANYMLTDVGEYSVDDLNENIYLTDFTVMHDGEDATGNFTIKYVQLTDKNGKEVDYTPMAVTPRKITITTNSESRVDNGESLMNSGYAIGGIGLADGERIEVEVNGICYAPGDVATNYVGYIYIYDQYDNMVFMTHVGEWYNGATMSQYGCNYEITFIYGTLEILPEEA